MPDVAIVMAAHNEERHIERAVRSCLAQTRKAELIVVDDGSTDQTALIAHRAGATVLDQKHKGLPAALNTGIRAANAQFIVRVDADDYVHNEFVNVLALHLELNKDWEAVACDYYTVDEYERQIGHGNVANDPIGCGIMFRKDRLVEIGLYDEKFLLWEDRELRSRFGWPVHRCQLPLYRYRRHPGSMTYLAAS